MAMDLKKKSMKDFDTKPVSPYRFIKKLQGEKLLGFIAKKNPLAAIV